MSNTSATFYLHFLSVVFLIFLLNPLASGQDSTRQSPVIFGEFLMGHAGGGGGGFSLGTEGNFQTGKSLFSVQYLSTIKISTRFALYIIPVFEQESSQQTLSLLYGRRFINGGMSGSFSAGVSYNIFEEADVNASDGYRKTVGTGFPFEANIKWFKAEKNRFRIIYGLVPVGKPTGFGRSIGFKFFGNVSKNSFAGLALTAGLGVHKKY